MADEALLKWIATRYPGVEVHMKEDAEFRATLAQRRQVPHPPAPVPHLSVTSGPA
jgi:hypothetical protein